MLSVAMKIGQRLGLCHESRNTRYTPLEAEMRRRLWWSLAMFDNRISEMSDYKSTLLHPAWDCKTPLNCNDFDLRPEIKTPPPAQPNLTEAAFVVIRSEISDFVRNSHFHLEFGNPAYKALVRNTRHGVPQEIGIKGLEKSIEDKYLRFFKPENPLHFMTIWMMRGQIAKNLALEHYSRHWFSVGKEKQTDAELDLSMGYARRMLECDTKLMTSPVTHGFRWMVTMYQPVPAYYFLFSELRARPLMDDELQLRVWNTIDANYTARKADKLVFGGAFFKMIGKRALSAWEARENALTTAAAAGEQRGGGGVPLPCVIADVRLQFPELTPEAQPDETPPMDNIMGMSIDAFSSSEWPMDFANSFGAAFEGNFGTDFDSIGEATEYITTHVSTGGSEETQQRYTGTSGQDTIGMTSSHYNANPMWWDDQM